MVFLLLLNSLQIQLPLTAYTWWGPQLPPTLGTPLHNLGGPTSWGHRSEQRKGKEWIWRQTGHGWPALVHHVCCWCGLTWSQQQGILNALFHSWESRRCSSVPIELYLWKICQYYHLAFQTKHITEVSLISQHYEDMKKILNILVSTLVRTQIVSVLKFSSPFGNPSFLCAQSLRTELVWYIGFSPGTHRNLDHPNCSYFTFIHRNHCITLRFRKNLILTEPFYSLPTVFSECRLFRLKFKD